MQNAVNAWIEIRFLLKLFLSSSDLGAKFYSSLRAARFTVTCRDSYRYISFPFLPLNSLCDVQKTDTC